MTNPCSPGRCANGCTNSPCVQRPEGPTGIWVAIRGAYDDQQVVGVATSEAGADELLRQLGIEPNSYEGITWGPFTPGKLNRCGQHGKTACVMCHAQV